MMIVIFCSKPSGLTELSFSIRSNKGHFGLLETVVGLVSGWYYIV